MISKANAPNGRIYITARIQYSILRNIVKITHFVHNFSFIDFLVPDYNSYTILYISTTCPSTVKMLETIS